jgi:hypothetical protein
VLFGSLLRLRWLLRPLLRAAERGMLRKALRIRPAVLGSCRRDFELLLRRRLRLQ